MDKDMHLPTKPWTPLLVLRKPELEEFKVILSYIRNSRPVWAT